MKKIISLLLLFCLLLSPSYAWAEDYFLLVPEKKLLNMASKIQGLNVRILFLTQTLQKLENNSHELLMDYEKLTMDYDSITVEFKKVEDKQRELTKQQQKQKEKLLKSLRTANALQTAAWTTAGVSALALLLILVIK